MKAQMEIVVSCVFLVILGLFGITSSLRRRAELSEEEETACGRSLGVNTGRQRALL